MYNIFALQLSDFHPSATLPQAIGSLWSYATQTEIIRHQYQMKKVFWQNESSEQVIQQIDQPDVLMCSCYVWNWKRTYEVIQYVRKNFPQCLIVIGGPEPHYSLEWMQKHPEVDLLVPYYGEEVFTQILIENLKEKNFSALPGLITQKYHNTNTLYPAFDKIPSPYLNGFFDQLLKELRPETKSVRCVFESNRGCPYSCTFCDIGSKAYQKLQVFPLENCFKELAWIVKNNIAVVDVADSNFGILPRDEEIVDELIRLKAQYSWNGRFLPTWSKVKSDKVLAIAKKIIHGKLDTIFGLSLQSFHAKTLENIKRKNAFDLQQLSDIVLDMNKSDVPVYTELIFPLPGDTLSQFTEDIYRMLDMEHVFNKFQINQLSRYPNTEMFSAEHDQKFNVEWVKIKGFTRHYYGQFSEDIISIGNNTISPLETFEGLFFTKCFVIPLYFYGIIREFADELHRSRIMTRSQLLKNILSLLSHESWFQDLKKSMQEHYFSAIQHGQQFGHSISSDPLNFYPEFARAHQFYLKNSIHEFLIWSYPQFKELIEFDSLSTWTNKQFSLEKEFFHFKKGTWKFLETREMSHDAYLSELYISGRFDNRWRKQNIQRI